MRMDRQGALVKRGLTDIKVDNGNQLQVVITHSPLVDAGSHSRRLQRRVPMYVALAP
jgi:hypothetical protein